MYFMSYGGTILLLSSMRYYKNNDISPLHLLNFTFQWEACLELEIIIFKEMEAFFTKIYYKIRRRRKGSK